MPFLGHQIGQGCVRCSVSESLERLGLDYIDVILVHDVEYVDDLKEVRLHLLDH